MDYIWPKNSSDPVAPYPNFSDIYGDFYGTRDSDARMMGKAILGNYIDQQFHEFISDMIEMCRRPRVRMVAKITSYF